MKVAYMGPPVVMAMPKPAPKGAGKSMGKSAMAPGQMKRAAGAKSARGFTKKRRSAP